MARTPKKPKKTPRTQNRESPTNITKDQRSEFGKILYNDFLRGEGRRLTQKDLAQAMGVSQSTISELMYHVAAIGYDQDAYDRLHNLFKGLNDLHVPISHDMAWKLLDAVKDYRGNKDAYFSEQRKRELIAALKRELIIKQTYLTSHLTALIGREKDIATVWSLLLEKDVRLLTLTGVPGVGKTEVAIQIEKQARSSDVFDHVYFIPLETVTNVDDVIPTISRFIGERNIRVHRDIQQLITYLKAKRILIILDNYEQLIDAREQLEELLRDCLKLKFLITSRSRLNLLIEKEYPVPPLEIPPNEMAIYFPARAAYPDMDTIRQVMLMDNFDWVSYFLSGPAPHDGG